MKLGICKLCLQERDLQDSHWIPASFYRRIKKTENTDPLVLTPNLVIATSKQIRDYVFCAECEHRLNVGGEQYVFSISAEGKTFPIVDKLRPHRSTGLGPFLRYSARETGIDAKKLGYFAVSMLWRGAVHRWKTIDRQINQTAVGSHMEEMRRFLMGEIPLVPEINVMVTVCLDRVSQTYVLAPYLVGGEETDTLFKMLFYGISLTIGVNHPNAALEQLCCVHSTDPSILVHNCEADTTGSVEHFFKTARHAPNVKLGSFKAPK